MTSKAFQNGASGNGSSPRLKVGLAEMLRGGVIMDVVDADQAKIAEERMVFISHCKVEVKIHTQSGPCRVLNKVTFLHMRLSTLQESRVLNKA